MAKTVLGSAMSYSIKVHVNQGDTDAYFHVIEESVWQYGGGGTWTNNDGVLTLEMGSSGTSGMLRFQTEEKKEIFSVVFGVHNYKPWTHVQTGLASNQTCGVLLPEYYSGGKFSHVDIATPSKVHDSEHRTITSEFRVYSGNNLDANIIIG